MSILKKSVDNRSDIFDNPDSSSLENLQNLRNELKQRYYKTQLDAYTLYVYGIVLNKLKLNDEAVLILLEAVNKQPTLWCAWLELANLIKSIDILNNLNHSALPQHWIKDLFLAHCYMELSLSEEALNIYQEYCNRGFNNSIYIKSQIARCYDNMRGK
jgi:anaphase-promoting complex subunit 8